MWMKIDDQLHHHRKTRKVTKSHEEKRRDAAPMGLWILAGAWAAQNNTGGWVPNEQLETWDDDWEALAGRLVSARYWWPEERDGEGGHGFHDWFDWNTASKAAAAAGRLGNHEKWHTARGMVNPNCEHCPDEPPEEGPDGPWSPPDRGAIGPDGADIAPDRGASTPDEPDEIADLATRSGGSRVRSGGLADPVPVPDPEPEKPSSASADAERVDGASSRALDKDLEADFAEWYAEYPRKKDKGHAVKAYKAARRKTGVTRELLLDALRQQLPELLAREPSKQPYPGTWLNGERWADEPSIPDTPTTGAANPWNAPHPSQIETAPSGMTDEESLQWIYDQYRKNHGQEGA